MTEDESKPSTDALLVEVGKRIRDCRTERGMTQQQFAKAAGMSVNYAQRVDAGQQNLSLRSLSRIAVALGVTMSSLLEGVVADPASVVTRPWRRRPKSDAD